MRHAERDATFVITVTEGCAPLHVGETVDGWNEGNVFRVEAILPNNRYRLRQIAGWTPQANPDHAH